jgi:hypothetical protein
MAYTAQQLITESWYLSGIASRALQSVTNQQITDGLERLNAILDVTTMSIDLIPFWQEYNSTFVAGQEIYALPGIVQIETAAFFIPADSSPNLVRYPLREATRQEYFAYSRVEGIETLPYIWHLERNQTGGNLYFYYLPQSNWAFQLWAKFSPTNVGLQTDMSIPYQGFYLEWLKYKLANYMCELYNVTFSLSHKTRLDSYEQMIKNASPLDFTQKKLSQFQNTGAPDYAMENLGKGFYPV